MKTHRQIRAAGFATCSSEFLPEKFQEKRPNINSESMHPQKNLDNYCVILWLMADKYNGDAFHIC